MDIELYSVYNIKEYMKLSMNFLEEK